MPETSGFYLVLVYLGAHGCLRLGNNPSICGSLQDIQGVCVTNHSEMILTPVPLQRPHLRRAAAGFCWEEFLVWA